MIRVRNTHFYKNREKVFGGNSYDFDKSADSTLRMAKITIRATVMVAIVIITRITILKGLSGQGLTGVEE